MNVLESLISFIAPTECISCGQEGLTLCITCQNKLEPSLPRCFMCSVYLDVGYICMQCRAKGSLKKLSITTEYKGIAKELVHALKFKHERAAAASVARCMYQELIGDDILSDNLVIIPLPSATTRVRQRGFDHTLLIAKKLSALTSLPFVAALGRAGQGRQVGKTRRERLALGAEQFIVHRPRDITGRTILLVDDVVTTGATLQAAAKALRQAGAKRVYGAVFAFRR